jgi:hypothetical protein
MDIGDLSFGAKTLVVQLYDECKKTHIFGVYSLLSPKFELFPIFLSRVAFFWTLEHVAEVNMAFKT